MADVEIDNMHVSFTADTAGFTQGAKQAAETLSQFEQSADKANAELQGLTSILDTINAGLGRIEQAVMASTTSIHQMTAALSGINTAGAATEEAVENITQVSDAVYSIVPVTSTAVATMSQLGELSFSTANGVTDIGEAADGAGAGLSEASDALKDTTKQLGRTEDKTDDFTKALDDMAKQLDEARTRSDKLEQELDDLRKKYDDLKNSTNNDELFSGLKKGLVTLGIGKFFKDATDFAGELEQNIGGAESVFKAYSGSIKQTAKTAYESLGLSESKYLATATKMGALFQGTGSSAAKSAEMTENAMKRAADVASIMGISIDDAMYSISGMAKGNFTMMDNLGVAMNDTTLQIYAQEKGLGKLETTQQKVNAAYQMFIDKTEYAAGNYEKENATYAGSLSTLKAEFENFMAEAGTAAMPLVTEGIKLLSGALQDLSPIILAVASGIGAVGDVVEAMPEPLVKMATYVITAATAWKKLNAILGATTSKLMLILSIASFVLGGLQKIGDKYKELNEAADSSLDGASSTTDDLTSSIDGLGDSADSTTKSLSKLAGFDEITKLSGGSSTLGSQIVSDEDLDNIENYMANLDEMSVDLENGFDVSLNFDWEATEKALEDIGANIHKTIQGILDNDLKAQYDALTKLNEYVKVVFGEKFTSTFENLGNKIADTVHSNENWKNEHRYDFNMQELRGVIVEYLKQGYSATAAWSLSVEKWLDSDEKKEWFGIFGQEEGYGIKLSDVELLQSNLEENGQITKNEFLTSENVVDTTKAWFGLTPEEQRALIRDYDAVAGLDLKETEEQLPTTLELVDSVWNWVTGNTGVSASSLQPDRVSAEDLLALQRAGNAGPIDIHNYIELDGEVVGESVTNYQNEQAYRSNGMTAYN